MAAASMSAITCRGGRGSRSSYPARVPCSMFSLPGSCSCSGFDVRGSMFGFNVPSSMFLVRCSMFDRAPDPNAELGTPNSEPRTRNPEFGTPNPELGTPNSELRTRNAELGTPNPELGTEREHEPGSENPEPGTVGCNLDALHPDR